MGSAVRKYVAVMDIGVVVREKANVGPEAEKSSTVWVKRPVCGYAPAVTVAVGANGMRVVVFGRKNVMKIANRPRAKDAEIAVHKPVRWSAIQVAVAGQPGTGESVAHKANVPPAPRTMLPVPVIQQA